MWELHPPSLQIWLGVGWLCVEVDMSCCCTFLTQQSYTKNWKSFFFVFFIMVYYKILNSPLCYTIAPYCLSILYVCLHLMIPDSQSFPPPGNLKFVVFLFLRYIHLCCILESFWLSIWALVFRPPACGPELSKRKGVSPGQKGHRLYTGEGRIFFSLCGQNEWSLRCADSWRFLGLFPPPGTLLGAGQTLGQIFTMSFKTRNIW